ncbi:MAG TPA: Mpo1-like protein, partial [Rhizobacter sp.]|nr:Mpo1-like protein [Rhizobacter sp.]
MRNATELMVQYAAYHRDRRNIATHFVGIPMIAFGLFVLLSRPTLFELGGLAVNGAWILWALGTLWYLTRGNVVLALATSGANLVLLLLAQTVAGGSTASWLAWGAGSFFVGWVIQFIGHYYEGRKPAFADDLIGLMVGPMFVTGEAL